MASYSQNFPPTEARNAVSTRPSKDRWRDYNQHDKNLALDEPHASSLPQREETASQDDSVIDLAHWLRTTEPPEPPRSSKSTKSPRKLVKKSRKSQSVQYRELRDLTGFKPSGVQERFSKDGEYSSTFLVRVLPRFVRALRAIDSEECQYYCVP